MEPGPWNVQTIVGLIVFFGAVLVIGIVLLLRMNHIDL